MTDSIMKDKIKKAIVIFAWLCILEIAAMLVDNSILLVGPVRVLKRLSELLMTADFYTVCLQSFCRIMLGLLSAFFAGVLFGYLMYRFSWFEEIWAPVLSVMKSVPVASFVVLLLIWQGAARLSVFVCFLVVFPNVCVSMKSGLCAVDPKMAEMARIYQIRGHQKWLYIYRPALLPYLISCMEIAVGMSFKSGVAAEVIGTPDYSIGERIYISKVYLDTAGLFAWTLTLICLSFLAERIILWGMKQLAKPLRAAGGKRKRTEKTISGKTLKTSDTERKKDKSDNTVTMKAPDNHDNQTAKDKITSEIKINDLKKSYGDHIVFEHLNMILKKGERYCLTAPSGSGKTTLFRILSGLTQADEGFVEGHGACAYLFQEERFADNELTINNIMLTASKSGLSVNDISEITDGLLTKEALYLPVQALSGGMKRRAALIRAMLYRYDDPSAVCLLDEPFAGLDEETKQKAVDFICKSLRGRTLIVATHEERDAELLKAKNLLIS